LKGTGSRTLETFLNDTAFPGFEDISFFLKIIERAAFDTFTEHKVIPPIEYSCKDNDEGKNADFNEFVHVGWFLDALNNYRNCAI
jgi:hypothetical protein